MKFDKNTLNVEIKFYDYDGTNEIDYSQNVGIGEDESVRAFVDKIEKTIKELVKEEE